MLKYVSKRRCCLGGALLLVCCHQTWRKMKIVSGWNTNVSVLVETGQTHLSARLETFLFPTAFIRVPLHDVRQTFPRVAVATLNRLNMLLCGCLFVFNYLFSILRRAKLALPPCTYIEYCAVELLPFSAPPCSPHLSVNSPDRARFPGWSHTATAPRTTTTNLHT